MECPAPPMLLQTKPADVAKPVPIEPPIRESCQRKGRERESRCGSGPETARSDRHPWLSVQSRERRPLAAGSPKGRSTRPAL